MPHFIKLLSIAPEGEEEFFDLTVPGTECYFDAQGILHHNSGKGYTVAKLFSWLGLVVCSIAGDPALYFDLAPETKMVMMNVAPTEDLAKNVFFMYLTRFLKHPLIQRFEPKMNSEDVKFFRDGRYGKYEFLSIYSRHSNAAGLDGHNLLAFAGDEIDDFPRTDVECRATKIHGIMRSSAETRFGRRWLGAMFSYPRTDDGFLMKIRKQALEDMEANGPQATMFTDLAASWVVRPNIDMNSKVIRNDYKTDPRGARARYECEPMPAVDTFFEYDDKVRQALNPNAVPVATWREAMGEVRTRHGIVPCVRVELGEIRPEPGRTYFLGGDGGITGDAFAVAIFSVPTRGWEESLRMAQPVQVESSKKVEYGGQDAARINPFYNGPQAMQTEPIHWMCGNCADQYPNLLSSRPYERQPEGSRWEAVASSDIPLCAVCASRASVANRKPDSVTFATSYWWRAGRPTGLNAPVYEAPPMRIADTSVDEEEAPDSAQVMLGGHDVTIPRVREELVLTWSPRQRLRRGDTIATVDLVNVEEVITTLITRLNIKRAGFDPYQMESMAQRIQGHNGCLVETVPFTQEGQYTRGRTVKALLYSHLIDLLPCRMPVSGDGWSYDFMTHTYGFTGDARRDIEWLRLQRKGKKLDHPVGGSKDIYDAESVAISMAINDWMGNVEIHWTD